MQTQLNVLNCDILVYCTSSGQCRVESERMIDKIILTLPKILVKTLSASWRVIKVLVLGLIEDSNYNQYRSENKHYKLMDFRKVL